MSSSSGTRTMRAGRWVYGIPGAVHRTSWRRSGPLTIDLANRVVTFQGRRVPLTPKEYRLLQVLAQYAGNVVTHQFLLKEIWGTSHVHDVHYLRIFVRKLRQKIEVDPTQPQVLLTELGIGYRLAIDEQQAATPAA